MYLWMSRVFVDTVELDIESLTNLDDVTVFREHFPVRICRSSSCCCTTKEFVHSIENDPIGEPMNTMERKILTLLLSFRDGENVQEANHHSASS